MKLPEDSKYIRGIALRILAYNGELKCRLFVPEEITRTGSRRSELKSRTFLSNEQLDPSNLVQLEDKMIQHRGGNLWRRYELVVTITLLSLE